MLSPRLLLCLRMHVFCTESSSDSDSSSSDSESSSSDSDDSSDSSSSDDASSGSASDSPLPKKKSKAAPAPAKEEAAGPREVRQAFLLLSSASGERHQRAHRTRLICGVFCASAYCVSSPSARVSSVRSGPYTCFAREREIILAKLPSC